MKIKYFDSRATPSLLRPGWRKIKLFTIKSLITVGNIQSVYGQVTLIFSFMMFQHFLVLQLYSKDVVNVLKIHLAFTNGLFLVR